MSQKHVDLYNEILAKRLTNLDEFLSKDIKIECDNDLFISMCCLSQDLLDYWDHKRDILKERRDYRHMLCDMRDDEISEEMIDLSWLRFAKSVAQNSPCSSRKIGAVLRKDGIIIGTGWNHSPGDCSLCSNGSLLCRRRRMKFESGQGLSECPAIHAECAAIYDAVRHGHKTDNSIIYCYCPLPCRICAGVIVEFGIKTVVCTNRFLTYDDVSARIFADNNITIRDIDKEIIT